MLTLPHISYLSIENTILEYSSGLQNSKVNFVE